jgi:hypothetical protein
MKEKVTLNVKEQKRLPVMNEIVAGRIIGQQAKSTQAYLKRTR